MMNLINLHSLYILILGLAVAGFGLRSRTAVLVIFLIVQGYLLFSYVFTRRRDMGRFLVNSAVALLLCMAVWLYIR